MMEMDSADRWSARTKHNGRVHEVMANGTDEYRIHLCTHRSIVTADDLQGTERPRRQTATLTVPFSHLRQYNEDKMTNGLRTKDGHLLIK